MLHLDKQTRTGLDPHQLRDLRFAGVQSYLGEPLSPGRW